MVAGAVLLGIKPLSRVYLLTHFSAVFILLMISRLFLHYYLQQRAETPLNSRQILLVGSAARVKAAADALDNQPSWGHQVIGYLDSHEGHEAKQNGVPLIGDIEDFDAILVDRQVDEVVFALPHGSRIRLEGYLRKCRNIGVTVRIVPAMFKLENPTLRVETIQGIPTLTDEASISTASGLFYKKLMDLIAGAFGFLLFLVLYPVIGLAIKLDSPGPVLYKQVRIGQHGRRFYLYKFRSMGVGSEGKKAALLDQSEMNGPMFKMADDPRLTRVGRFLRKTSLDEFPQFINVLKGEMSIVGTRPPTPDEVKAYEDWHRRRISIKPGITGLWQVSGRNEIVDFSEVVKLDLQYIDGWRFWRDIVILSKTIWVVLARKGAK